MALTRCPECDKEISDKARKCPHCGYPIKTSRWVCPECGETMDAEFDSCWKCANVESCEQPSTARTVPSRDTDKSHQSLSPLVVINSIIRIGIAIWMLFNCSFIIGNGFYIMHKRHANLNNIIVFQDNPHNLGQVLGSFWVYKGIIFGIGSSGVHFFEYW